MKPKKTKKAKKLIISEVYDLGVEHADEALCANCGAKEELVVLGSISKIFTNLVEIGSEYICRDCIPHDGDDEEDNY